MTDDVRWLSPRELRTWMRLQAVSELLPGVLDAQLQRDAQLTHFEYLTLAMLSEAPEHMLRMTDLALKTNATLPRLSHVVKRLEGRGYVERRPCPEDRRATLAILTSAGWDKVVATAPGHVENVREHIIDRLTPEQVDQLDQIARAILVSLDTEGRLDALHLPEDPED
jgi:DNA-binding MarR family transcriptional regulator